MRTKTILLSAAVLAAGLSVSVAQSVFSVNAVGYVNKTIVPGYNLIANPLNGAPGTPTNNLLSTIIPTAPDGSLVLKWNPATQQFAPSDSFVGGAWFDGAFNPSTTVIAPGEGFFFQNNSGANTTLTFVGEVPQGPALIVPIGPNYSLVSSIVPQSAGLPALGFPGSEGMAYLPWNPVTQQYGASSSYLAGVWYDASFNPVDPAPAVGEGFYINNPGAAVTWTRAFSVN